MRVMRILTRPNLGGPTRQAVALWHAHRELGVTTLLATGCVDPTEAELSPADGGVPVLSFDEALARGPATAGWVVVPGLQRGINPLADRRAGKALRALMRAVAPDVVHTHTSKAGWLGRAAARAVGVGRIVHTFHGHVLQDYFGRGLSWLLARLEARLAARTDVLVAVSDSCADELAAAGVAPRQRFVVVPPAVAVPEALPRAAARAELGIAAGERRAVCVGRLVPVKRVDDFVRMVELGPEWAGDIVGDGPLYAAIGAQAAPLAGRVRRLGACPDIAGLLPAYDALVLPSVREGCPLVAVEAFAAGVPVVGYDVPGVHDALAGWGRGLLVPVAHGPQGLLAALRRLAAEPTLQNDLVAAGRASVGRFAPAAVAAALLAAYRGAPGCL
jgi:glycosyltransferase involved in cell wall biosynthesis